MKRSPGGGLAALVVAVGSGAGGLSVLLRRMRAELLRDGALRTRTATAMYGVYVVQAAAVLATARERAVPLPVPAPLTRAGAPLAVAGAALTVGGMQRFAGPAQLTGTAAGDLLTGGVYRWSRNPRYTGLVAVLVGLGLARRSGGVLLLATGTAGVYAWWVRIEERSLSRTSGDGYDVYRRRTARWLGPPRQG